ncbi:MAG: hypothetical protein FJY10_10605 [Bacteroidetes bacterium]|nr:hypothetical protein [Bacteroidota bacterium]
MRKCILIRSSPDNRRHIYVDEINSGELYDYIKQDHRHHDKFRFICDIILGGHKNHSLYSKEEIDTKTKGVTAMKFFPGQENDRIYCKEYTTPAGSMIVIAVELFLRKKQTKLTHKEKSVIERIGSYEYEIQEL